MVFLEDTIHPRSLFHRHIYLAYAMLLVINQTVESYRHRREGDQAPIPRFLNMPRNVTFDKGGTAILPCSVENLGTKTVGWRKETEESPLTIGEVLFEQDPQLSIVHRERSSTVQDWNLVIKNVQPIHTGRYECQISATIPLKRFIQLNVKDTPVRKIPAITLTGSEYVENNQPINLTCNASAITHAPDDIDWFKNGQKIKGGSNNKIMITKYQSLADKSIVSQLLIDRASAVDAGTYVCRSSNLDVTSLRVHVLTANTRNVKRGEAGNSYSVEKQGTALGKTHKANSSNIVQCSTLELIYLFAFAYLTAKFRS